jgi:hypothetical protein
LYLVAATRLWQRETENGQGHQGSAGRGRKSRVVTEVINDQAGREATVEGRTYTAEPRQRVLLGG